MNDTPPTSRWNNENDPRGEKRRFLIKAEHLKAYQRTWNQFDKGLKKLKDSMRDNARKADWIQNEKLKELARTIQRSEDKETTGASRVAMTQISEDVALEILQNEDRGSSVEPIIAATIETLGSRHGIVRPWTDTTSATPANALEAPLHSIESDLAASSPAVSGTQNPSCIPFDHERHQSRYGYTGGDCENSLSNMRHEQTLIRLCCVTSKARPNPSIRRPNEGHSAKKEEKPVEQVYYTRGLAVTGGCCLRDKRKISAYSMDP
ncbi:hypothetical protein BKA61DRAFT_665755 [Leptodontidium sp. MPI-SDFR-AT-0119]|nr:hypothetical protein BKA61DRAFT_665755 [Leptodontidium sp. MPI-SDFR-AT-0119]